MYIVEVSLKLDVKMKVEFIKVFMFTAIMPALIRLLFLAECFSKVI